jgi:ABC-type sugar transport systems, permease components
MRIDIDRKQRAPLLFALPATLVMAVWLVFPMLSALDISLREWSIVPGGESPFIGLANYAQVLRDPVFWLSLKNTALFALVTVAGQLALGLAVALMIDKIPRGQVAFRTIYYLPVVTSWVVSSLLFKFLFNSSESGLVNYFLVDIVRLAPRPISWLTEAGTAFVVIDTLGVWKGVGFVMIIFLAALQSIPVELEQAASLDGAGDAQVLRSITLPILAPTAATVSAMLLIGAFQIYIPVAMITKGGPLHRTELVVSHMYSAGFGDMRFGYASALAYVLALIVFAISRVQTSLSRSAPAGE